MAEKGATESESAREISPLTSIETQLALKFVRVTEEGAIAAARTMGQGSAEGSDEAAVKAMRAALQEITMDGLVVIGEGERDEAPMLYIGEQLGKVGGPAVDIAVDPLEGTNLVARGLNNAIAVIAASERGGLLHAPDIYMEKLIVGPPAAGKVNINFPVLANLQIIADAMQRRVQDLTVVILDRDRHRDLIEEVREAGARIRLITDGDVTAAVACAISGTGVHAVMGIGGAPEGVLAAAALRCLGGDMVGRFWYRNDEERERVRSMGISDPDRVFSIDELAGGKQIVFVATAVTDGDMLRGVRFFGGGVRTHTLVMTGQRLIARFVEHSYLRQPASRPHPHLGFGSRGKFRGDRYLGSPQMCCRLGWDSPSPPNVLLGLGRIFLSNA